MQLQTTSPESKFPDEYTDVIFIQIDQRLKKLLPKYKGVPILWNTVYMATQFQLTVVINVQCTYFSFILLSVECTAWLHMNEFAVIGARSHLSNVVVIWKIYFGAII